MAEITGKIKIIGELQEFANNFTKIQLVVTSDEQYPSDIPIDFIKDKTNLLDDYNIGDDVSVSVNIKGSEYNGKYYVNLNGWKIQREQSEQQPQNNATTQNNPQEFKQANQQNSFVDDNSDFPFY